MNVGFSSVLLKKYVDKLYKGLKPLYFLYCDITLSRRRGRFLSSEQFNFR
jgi:hypothetical protein